MARTTTVILTDDMDGGEAVETVRFSLDGSSYEIDLSADNADALRSVVAEYAGSARSTGGTTRRRRAPGTRSTGSPRSSAAGGVDAKAVRAWAAQNHIEVSNRGRLPAALVAQFREASS